ncbi:MAG: protein phosphatase CheZ [Gammaproteobacteria bacterium]|nr:MAG: protein phosphatase CheZ [Gammaproteobacteria bacterium]
MANNSIDRQALLEKTKSLLTLLEQGDASEDDITSTLDEVMAFRETSLFHELGKMTREIHESIMNFRMDSRIADLAEHDIPDAKDRLEYVITMTENAANTVLTVVEKGTPAAEKLIEQSRHLNELWKKFRRREMNADELRAMGHEVETFFVESETMMTELLSGFTEVLMAQDFQDLTGQIIRRVINLVNEIEGNLVELIKIQGEHYKREEKPNNKNTGETTLEGPQVPGKESDDVMKGQDDVDDLLASLGF